MDEDLFKYQFESVIKEHEALRNELLLYGNRQLRLIELLIVILGIFYGLIGTTKSYDVLLIIPFFAAPFFLRYFWEQRNLQIIGRYIREEIEAKRIPGLIGYRNSDSDAKYDKLWIGWQHYWDSKGYAQNIVFRIYKKHLVTFILVLLSFIPSIFYGIYRLGLQEQPELTNDLIFIITISSILLLSLIIFSSIEPRRKTRREKN